VRNCSGDSSAFNQLRYSSATAPGAGCGNQGRGGGGAVERRPVVIQESEPAKKGFAGLSTGELIEVAAQILAAIQPLPGAPVAQGEVETDVENLVIYQTALATHAKRDEQLRTLGGLLGKILK